jgi:Rieske Fe-S protein
MKAGPDNDERSSITHPPWTTRRRFLNWLRGTAAGGLLVSVLYPLVRYIVPPASAEAVTNAVTL